MVMLCCLQRPGNATTEWHSLWLSTAGLLQCSFSYVSRELNLWLNVRGTISTDVYSRTGLCSVPGSLLRKEVRGPSDIILWARVPNENSQLERALLLFTFLSYCLRNLFLIALKVYLTDYVFSDILSGLKDLIFSYKTEL